MAKGNKIVSYRQRQICSPLNVGLPKA